MGVMMPGSRQAAAAMSEADWYQDVAPWLVTWRTPGRRAATRRRVIRARPARTVGVALAAVHVGPGRGVDDRVGSDVADDLQDSISVGHVEGGVVVPGDVVVVGGAERLDQFPSELAAGAGDEDYHAVSRTGRRPRSGSHQSRCSAYHATVVASPSSKPICGVQSR